MLNMAGVVPFSSKGLAGALRDEPYTHNQLGCNAALPPGPSSRITRLKHSLAQRLNKGKVHNAAAKRSSVSLKRASTSLSLSLSGAFRKGEPSSFPETLETDTAHGISSLVPEALRPGRRQQQSQFPVSRPRGVLPTPPPRPPPPVTEQQIPSGPIPVKRRREESVSEPITDDTAPLRTLADAGRPKKSKKNSQQTLDSTSPPMPRLSPVAQGIAVAERAQWLRENPKRTTTLDSAVQSPALVGGRFTSVAPGVDVPLAKPSQTFESILGNAPPAPGSLGPMHALGLKPPGVEVADQCGSRPRRRPLPNKSTLAPAVVPSVQNTTGRPLITYESPDCIGKPKEVPPLTGLASLPTVIRSRNPQLASTETIPCAPVVDANHPYLTPHTKQALASERKKAFRQSMRNELHFEHTSRPQSFRFPLEAAEEQLGHHAGPGGLAPAESTQLKRLSDGFLHAGPDLSEAAVQIFEQVRNNPPKVDSVRAKIDAIERGREESEAKPFSPVGTDISLFDGDSFPFLDSAARALATGKETLRKPLPPGYTSRNGGPPTVDRSAIGDYGWQRFSDREYVDPAVEDFQKNRRKRLNKRKQDLAAWDAAVSAAQEEALDPNVTTAAPDSELKAAAEINRLDGQDACEGENGQQPPPPIVTSERRNLLDMIDFTDCSDLSPPKSRNGSLPDDLIQF